MSDNRTTELRRCKHCGEKPQVLKSDGRAAHACRVLDRELRMTVDEWNAENEDAMTNYEKLFGTPEKAARTLKRMCKSMEECSHCPLYASGVGFCEADDDDGVAEWLESEVRDD